MRISDWSSDVCSSDLRRLCRTLARAGLEHPELALLHGKFDVLHIAIMRFQDSENLSEFGIGLGHGLFHGRELGPCPFTRLFGEILCRTDTRHYVLTLRIDQKFAIIAILSGQVGRATSELKSLMRTSNAVFSWKN